jgi:predicted DNA-binding WGR domain protein
MKEAAGPEQLRFLVLERRENAVNAARYCVLSVEPTLFAEVRLVREWGRIGSRGRRLVELHGTPQLAVEALDKWLASSSNLTFVSRQRTSQMGHEHICSAGCSQARPLSGEP